MEDTQPIKHVCGVCNDEWLTEAEYNGHTCPKTNATPEQPEHLINSTQPDFAAIQEAALARGAETAEPTGEGQSVHVLSLDELPSTAPAEPAPENPQPTISLN